MSSLVVVTRRLWRLDFCFYISKEQANVELQFSKSSGGAIVKATVLFFSLFLFGFSSFATQPYPPVGAEILSEAGHCPVGPFGRDGDVGEYAGYCGGLKRREVCTAYLVGIIQNDIHPVDPAKISFCKGVLVQ